MSASAHRRLHDPKYLQLHIPGNGHVQDVSGWGNVTAWSGTGAYATGAFSGHGVLSLGGANSVAVTHNARLSLAAYTISLWYKPTSVANIYYLISKGAGAGANYAIVANTTLLRIYDDPAGATAWGARVTSDIALAVGKLTFVCAAFDASGYRLYSDQTCNTAAYAAALSTNSTTLYVGADNVGTSQARGQMSNVRVYNVALTGSEISALYEFDRR